MIKSIEPITNWHNAQPSDPMPIYNINGTLYCAAGWNGEAFVHSFRVLNRYDVDPDYPEEVTLRPLYVFEVEGIDLDNIEENSDEWNRVTAFADFNIL